MNCRKMAVLLLCATGTLWFASPARAADVAAKDAAGLADALAKAKAGDVLVLGEGTFPAVALPDGASLRGAGCDKTIIDGASAAAAVAVAGGKDAVIEDLTVRTRGTAAVQIVKAANVTVRRVKIRGGAMGVRMIDVTGVRVENVVIDQAMTGVSLSNVTRSAIVNCTIYRSNSLAMSLVGVRDSAVFNNILADAGIGAMIAGKCDKLSMDHNLYLALFVGRFHDQYTRVSLGTWRAVSGLDASSVQLPVAFADPAKGDYRTTSALAWAPWRATTSDWGVAELAGFKAPDKDIGGAARVGAFDVGAYETAPLKEAKGDGEFEISADEGLKSAGVFAKDDTCVRYLFQAMPLKKGTYSFVLPSRSTLGQPIAAGDYQVRVAEGSLKWTYNGMIANNGVSNEDLDADFDSTVRVAFAADGALLMGNGWCERAMNLVKRDIDTRKGQWCFRGSANNAGLAVASDGSILLLREAAKGFTLSRVDAANGLPQTWADGKPFATLGAKDNKLEGLAELDGKLYVADAAGKLFITSLAEPRLDKSVELASPRLPMADRKHKLVWLLSGDKVLAVDAEGKVKVELADVKGPLGVAASGDRLAVASYETGKVHFFDIRDIAAPPKADGTLGSGDGPYGPIQPDRFWFKQGPYTTPWRVPLDLDAKGRLAVCDRAGRVLIFDKGGKNVYASFAMFGNAPYRAYFDDNGDKTRFFDNSGSFTWWIDPKNKAWSLDAYWGKPPLNGAGGNPPLNFFSVGGKKFGAFFAKVLKADGKGGTDGVLVVRYDGYCGKPVGFYAGKTVIRDTNNDGVIDAKDGEGTVLLATDGKPVSRPLSGRWFCGMSDGNMRNGTEQLWKLKGLDKDGNPEFEFPTQAIVPFKTPVVPSPYNFQKKANLAGQSLADNCPNGDMLVSIQSVEACPNGMGLSNSGAIDIFRARPDGSIRWYYPANDYGPIQGVNALDKFILTSWGHQTEWIGMDEDGLILGYLGFPAEGRWGGYWVDHPNQYRLFLGNDGKAHVMVGEYVRTCHHWFTLDNWNNSKKQTFPLKIDDALAAQLAVRAAEPTVVLAKPQQPQITIPRLKEALPIDGDLAKWRKAGITPQIVMTPVTASADITGPADASGIIRMAYEGKNLYVQVLRFDDVVTFHQTTEATHLQDTIEMMLNGFFPSGFQFSISKYLVDGKLSEEIVRRRFFFQGNKAYLVPHDSAPRVVKVLEDARDVEERGLIENVYGVDLSKCKVIVYEFKLPIDKVTWKESEDTLFEVGPGKTVWVGFMIDDNDVPGTDVQKLIVWPASYGTFSPKETGALATFE